MQRMFDPSLIEKKIQEYFYNALVSNALNSTLSKNNIDSVIEHAIIALIRDILNKSAQFDGIILPNMNNFLINASNCPVHYQPLFAQLNVLKTHPPSMQELQNIAVNIRNLESFKKIDPTQFLLETLGIVTPKMIRESFYNEMISQTLISINQHWMNYQMLIDQDPLLYLVLPAITILAAIDQSKNVKGIRLMNGQVVDKDNCPAHENFPQFIAAVLSIKDQVHSMSIDERKVMLCSIFTKDIPNDLKKRIPPKVMDDLMKKIASINSMAIDISREKVFKEMMEQTIDFCLESLKPEEENKKNQCRIC